MPRTNRSATRRARQPATLAAWLASAALATLAVVPAAASADVTFRAPVDYATAAGTQDVAIGDFNGDGRRDLVTANATAQSISILLGTGAGTFQPATSVPVNGQPGRLSVADFDGDGSPDLAVAVPGASKIDVLWGSGTGFTGATTSVRSISGAAKAIGTDLNADGRDDLVLVDGHTTLRAYVSGNRSFTETTSFAVGNEPIDVAPLSLSTPTNPGVITALRGTGAVRPAFGNGSGGLIDDGSYGVGGAGTVSTPNGVAVADITGDGRDDVVTSNGGTNNVTILAYSHGNLLAPQRSTPLIAGFGPTGITTGDFTGDGTADVAVVGADAEAVTVLRSGGAGLPMVAVGTYSSVRDAVRAAGADFNGDGAADLAVAATDGNVRVLLSQGHPTLSGQASASVAVGGGLTDSVTLAGATPTVGGTITFRLYGPGDETCSTPLATETRTVTGNGTYATPTTFTAPHAGVYRWVASYSGDATNDAVTGTCSDANQTTAVSKATPGASVTAPATVGVGTVISPQVTLAGGHAPTGTIVLRAYATADCSGPAAYTSAPISVSGNGGYPATPSFIPAVAQTYRWVASYSGDGDNESTANLCGVGVTSVTKRTPHLTVGAPPPIVVGDGSVRPSASLSNGYGATGTVTFSAYEDAACGGTPAWESEPVNVGGDGSYSPIATFTPPHAGAYRFVAHYSGDGANDAVSTGCGDAGTTLAVEARSPAITVAATAAITLGDAAPATATLDDGFEASGAITLSAYATGDCSGAPAYVSDPVPADGDGDYPAEPAFVPPHAGTYRWVAEFAGDADNAPAVSACGAAGTVAAVAPRTPTIDASATSTSTLGDPVQAIATLADTTDDAGGTLTFTAYADAACTGPAAFTGKPIAVDGRGEYASDQVVPDVAGEYRWIVRYSGDGDNASVATACGALGLTSTIAPRPPVPQPPGVPEPPVVVPPVLVPEPVAPLSRVAATRCLASTARGRTAGTVRYSVATRSRVTLTVQRRVDSPWPARSTCPKPMTGRSRETGGKYVGVRTRTGGRSRALRRTVTVGKGTHRMALRTLIGSTRLTPGRYRVLIQARGSDGRTVRAAAYLWVLKR